MFFLYLLLAAIVVAVVLALRELATPVSEPAEPCVRVVTRTTPGTRLIWDVTHTNRVMKARGLK